MQGRSRCTDPGGTRPDDSFKYYVDALIRGWYIGNTSRCNSLQSRGLIEASGWSQDKSLILTFILQRNCRKCVCQMVCMHGPSLRAYTFKRRSWAPRTTFNESNQAEDGLSEPAHHSHGITSQSWILQGNPMMNHPFINHKLMSLHWIVEISRINIITAVSMLSSYMADPWKGHLETVFHIFAYFEKKHNSRLIFDSSYPDNDMHQFKECDWK